jgi:CubicO group peptidase (beta-lactamase class C family)
MTSGYSYGGDADESEKAITALIDDIKSKLSTDHPVTTMVAARRLGRIPLSFNPGTDYRYGLSADILGAVVEAVSGMKFGDFLRTRLFEPLGMHDTGFYVPAEKHNRLARVYQGTSYGGLEPYFDAHLGIQNDLSFPPAFESGGAGLVSTIDDYLAFCRMLLQDGSFGGRQILQPQTVGFMRSAHINDALQLCFDRDMPHLAGYSYGNLLRIMTDPARAKTFGCAGEYGWDGWLGTFMMIDPQNKLIMVFMQQRPDCGMTGWTRRLKNVVYAAL